MRNTRLVGLCLAIVFGLVGISPRVSHAAGENAMLILLDKSNSMNLGSEWNTTRAAIVQALDDNAVDTMSVGLYAAPSGSVSGPVCVFGLPVPCAAPAVSQVPLAFAGTQKSTAPSGVRRSISDWLAANSPDAGPGDGFPLYAAAVNAMNELRAYAGPGPRTLLIITDGGISCGQLSSRPGYPDCGSCDHEWEAPDNLVSLLFSARMDPAKPISTYVIGLPNSNTAGPPGSCVVPPYHMRLALSAMAFAGSTHTVENCTGKLFTQSGGDPTLSCHQEVSSNVGAIAGAISNVRAATTLPPIPLFGAGWIAAALAVTAGAALMARRRR